MAADAADCVPQLIPLASCAHFGCTYKFDRETNTTPKLIHVHYLQAMQCSKFFITFMNIYIFDSIVLVKKIVPCIRKIYVYRLSPNKRLMQIGWEADAAAFFFYQELFQMQSLCVLMNTR